jgi:hypothetical protein
MPGKSPVPKKKTKNMAQTLVLARAKSSKKTKRRKSSKEEMYERRQMVMRLRLKGMTYKAIGKELGIGTMTVKRDLYALREDVSARVSKFDRDFALGECLQTYERIHQEAWNEYESCSHGSSGRATFLNLIRAAENDRVKVLMDVGLIGREAVKVEHNHKADQALKGITKDAQQLIAMALLKAQLQPPKEPIREVVEGSNGSGQKLLDIPAEMVTVVPADEGGNGA